MDMFSNILNFIFVILCGWLSAYLASKKGRNVIIWFLMGILFNIFAPLVLIFLPPVVQSTKKSTSSESSDPFFEGTTIDVKPIANESHSGEQPEAPENRQWFYLDSHHQQVGPVSFKNLKDLYKEGKLVSSTYLWCEGMKEWRSILDLKLKL